MKRRFHIFDLSNFSEFPIIFLICTILTSDFGKVWKKRSAITALNSADESLLVDFVRAGEETTSIAIRKRLIVLFNCMQRNLTYWQNAMQLYYSSNCNHPTSWLNWPVPNRPASPSLTFMFRPWKMFLREEEYVHLQLQSLFSSYKKTTGKMHSKERMLLVYQWFHRKLFHQFSYDSTLLLSY